MATWLTGSRRKPGRRAASRTGARSRPSPTVPCWSAAGRCPRRGRRTASDRSSRSCPGRRRRTGRPCRPGRGPCRRRPAPERAAAWAGAGSAGAGSAATAVPGVPTKVMPAAAAVIRPAPVRRGRGTGSGERSPCGGSPSVRPPDPRRGTARFCQAREWDHGTAASWPWTRRAPPSAPGGFRPAVPARGHPRRATTTRPASPPYEPPRKVANRAACRGVDGSTSRAITGNTRPSWPRSRFRRAHHREICVGRLSR